jgi:penicillin amidase
MPNDTTRRAFLGALLAGGTGAAALSPAGGLLDSFAPLSGRTWQETRGEVPDTVASEYGEATVTYDDYRVPHVEADSEEAAYYAVGYAQAADRLFGMDLVRRLMDGRLSAAVGEQTVESDVFHAKMDFRGAAEASKDALEGSRTEAMTAAYADGVNAYIEDGPKPLEAALVGYDIDEWTVVDSLLVGTQISWGLTGSFESLRRAVLRERLETADYRRLYEAPFDHGAPIIREGTTGEIQGVDGFPASPAAARVDSTFVDWLSAHEPPPLWGSNHWAVAGDHTESGSPILAYDPHLTLMVPPVWYEQHVTVANEDIDVRGAGFPGIPFVIVGENQHGAWGFTNVGGDVVDHYTYETDGDQYRHAGEWRDFETETRTIEVAGGENRDIEVRKTVHGAYVDREIDGETRHVGVAWTGMSGTRESEAIYEFSKTEGLEDYRDAIRKMDVPTQNALYVDDERIYYKVTGKVPIRRQNGEVIDGNRVFDGSAGEGGWEGFEPFGQSDWDGGEFVPFEEKPGVVDPDYIGTANQRVVDDPTYPIGFEYASGFRGMRVYERLDRRIAGGEPVDSEFMASVQRDTLDIRARKLVPAVLDARDRIDGADRWLDALAEWDYRMDRDSAAALVFHHFYEEFRNATWSDDFEELGLDEGWWPQEWVLTELPPDDEFFGGDRAAVIAEAMEAAVERIETEGWSVYGDYHRTTIDHEFGGQVPALNYPRYPTDGSAFTLFNTRDGLSAGSSWRQISSVGKPSRSILPGGQSGSVFSDHYDDQLRMWADGEYKGMAFETPDSGDVIEFRGEDE